MSEPKAPKAPAYLRPSTRSWWSAVVRDFALERHHVHLLTLAAEALDRCAQAREALAVDGLTIATGDGGCKAHPLVTVERDARLAYARLLRELDLDTELPSAGRRPPALRSNSRR